MAGSWTSICCEGLQAPIATIELVPKNQSRLCSCQGGFVVFVVTYFAESRISAWDQLATLPKFKRGQRDVRQSCAATVGRSR